MSDAGPERDVAAGRRRYSLVVGYGLLSVTAGLIGLAWPDGHGGGVRCVLVDPRGGGHRKGIGGRAQAGRVWRLVGGVICLIDGVVRPSAPVASAVTSPGYSESSSSCRRRPHRVGIRGPVRRTRRPNCKGRPHRWTRRPVHDACRAEPQVIDWHGQGVR
jgi:hypothetical protein